MPGFDLTRRAAATVAALALVLVGTACAGVSRAVPSAPQHASRWTETGVASWYGHPFHGRRTASGETYDMRRLTAAHPTLPFGTSVRVRNMDNDREVTVRINDRGPFVKQRIIDLSRAAAQRIDMVGPGTARVTLSIAR